MDRHQLADLENEPRRRRVSISWDDLPRLILVAATPHSARALDALPTLLAYLQSIPGIIVAVEEKLAPHCPPSVPIVRPPHRPEIMKATIPPSMESLTLTDSTLEPPRTEHKAEEVDLVMCLGGDGLIFHVISQYFPKRVPPFVPFNMGSMGFLTPFDFGNHPSHIKAILDGSNNTVTMRMRLKCVVARQPVVPDGTTSPSIHNFQNNMLNEGAMECSVREEHHVLNELVIDRGPAPYLSNLEVLCDDCPVTRVQADGLIVATPTGSTAYSLSSGGSMVHPGVPAILFTPICPHSLSFRPVLFPDHVTLQIKVPKDSRATAWVSFDGRHRMELMKGDKVVVSVSPWPVPTFSRAETTNDWFASVSQCLRWNERVVQGAQD